ncbi:hypothetical protein PVAND_002127 [Polypedilum vanderplanki]|uniref:Odorant binding protein n=1 Tax=Polypedilum vanderplanki TaxID=319348 RepID=A0A9J6BQ10_POLVA|nr:hypothetical protein PVAND_002127 [Polypedilum vanderplanki]
MKFFVILATVFVFATADLSPFREACKNELNIPEASIENYKRWQFNDEHSACYIECIFKKMGLFTDGNFNLDLLAQKLKGDDKTEEEIKPEIEKCIDNSITNHCDKAFNGFKCFKEKNLYRVQQSAHKH